MTTTVAPAGQARRRGLWSTTIGKKLLVAVTGIGWIGFVVVHMIGNLKLFLGPEGHGDNRPALNVYGCLLYTSPSPRDS